ncbi:MAG: ATP-binding protein [Pseudomonadota bacterium]
MKSGGLHRHLVRQLRKLGLSVEAPPSAAAWYSFLDGVARTYEDSDLERYTLERSVGLFEGEMRELNNKLEAERDRMRLVFEMAPVGILRAELDGTLTLTNPALQRMLGFSGDELGAMTTSDILHPDDRGALLGSMAAMVATATRTPLTVQGRLPSKRGATIHINLSASLALGGGGEPLFTIAIVKDISERLRLEMELRQAQKLEAVGRLAAGIAHEINTPIQFIGDNTSFVQSAFADLMTLCGAYMRIVHPLQSSLAAEQRAELREAEEAADIEYLNANVVPAFAATLDGVARVSGIVKAMKAFAHPGQVEKVHADLNAAIESTLIVVANELKYVATVHTEFGVLPLVPCFVSDLNQVFLNLFINAAHSIGDVVGTSGERGTISVATHAESASVVISVTDTGTGIPLTVQPRIFDPFFTTKEVGRGSGQGLAISRAVVQQHGGTLTFETEPGKGTTFFVRLPTI